MHAVHTSRRSRARRAPVTQPISWREIEMAQIDEQCRSLPSVGRDPTCQRGGTCGARLPVRLLLAGASTRATVRWGHCHKGKCKLLLFRSEERRVGKECVS